MKICDYSYKQAILESTGVTVSNRTEVLVRGDVQRALGGNQITDSSLSFFQPSAFIPVPSFSQIPSLVPRPPQLTFTVAHSRPCNLPPTVTNAPPKDSQQSPKQSIFGEPAVKGA